jgi:hypothetical protein
MKTIANRILVIAASVIALGTVAYGQTTMTAAIPFAFHAAQATLPAGTYTFDTHAGIAHNIVIRNQATLHATFGGVAILNDYSRTNGASIAEFTCVGKDCTLTAVRTRHGSLEYAAPKARKPEDKVAVISFPLRALNAD